jgi:hypothetical protein
MKQALKASVIGLIAAIALFSCRTQSKELLLRTWLSRDTPVGDRVRAASALVTNGTPRAQVDGLLGRPDYQLHSSGYVPAASEPAPMPTWLRHEGDLNPPAWRNEEEDVTLYRCHDGGVVAFRFQVIGFESNYQRRPLIGIYTTRTNGLPFPEKSNSP